jgi:hypothetical protein
MTRSYYITAASLAWVLPSLVAAGSEVEVETIRSSWEARSKAIHTLDIHWDCEHRILRGGKSEEERRLDAIRETHRRAGEKADVNTIAVIPPTDVLFQTRHECAVDSANNRIRLSHVRPQWSPGERQFKLLPMEAYLADGQVTRYYPRGAINTTFPDAVRTPGRSLSELMTDEFAVIGMVFFPGDPSRSLLNPSAIVLEGSANGDVQRISIKTRGTTIHYLDLEIAHTFRPLRVEARIGMRTLWSAVITYRPETNSDSVPQGWELKRFQTDASASEVLDCRVSTCKVNSDLDRSLFVAQFSHGAIITEVSGQRENHWVVDKHGEAQVVQPVALMQPYDDLIRAVDEREWRRKLFRWLFAAGALLIGFVSFAVWRWRRNARTEGSKLAPSAPDAAA